MGTRVTFTQSGGVDGAKNDYNLSPSRFIHTGDTEMGKKATVRRPHNERRRAGELHSGDDVRDAVAGGETAHDSSGGDENHMSNDPTGHLILYQTDGTPFGPKVRANTSPVRDIPVITRAEGPRKSPTCQCSRDAGTRYHLVTDIAKTKSGFHPVEFDGMKNQSGLNSFTLASMKMEGGGK